MADKKISELDLALQINNDAVFPMSQDNGGTDTTYKVTITQLGTEIAEDMTFSNLQTTSKKIVSAINELLSLGSPIIIGTTAPTSSIGADGNIYVQYTAGTGGADDEVDGIYVKIDGAWCEISTGGGGGTTDYEDLSNKPQVNSVELVGNKSLDDLGIMPASLSKTVSGSIAHFTDGANNIPVKSLVSQIVAVESGNGQPKSPENHYIISGFDSGIITRSGVNLWDEQWELGTLNTTTGANASATTRIRSKNYIPVKPNTTYTYRQGTASRQTTGRACYYDVNKNFISSSVYFPSETETFNGVATFTTPNNACYMRFSPASGYGTTYGNDISILYPSTITEYKSYNGNNYTFTFGQTVYGGYFNNKGNLVLTHGIVDLGSLNWGDDALHTSGSVPDMASGNYSSDLSSYSCEQFVSKQRYVGWASMIDGEFGINEQTIRCKWSPSTTGAEFKTLVTGCKFVYPLATPITLSITSQDIPTIFGENNIFSNCGDVEVNYYTDKADEIVEVAKATASTPLHHYSEDEHIVGTWIDGKALYEKTVIITNAGKDASYDLGITDFDTCFVYNGSFSGNGIIPYLHGSYPDNSIGGFLDDTGSSLAWAFRSGSQVPATISGFITVRYTKTT